MKLDPMGLGEEATGDLLNGFYRRQGIWTGSRGVPCYPLGSSPEKTVMLRQALEQSYLESSKLPGPALIEVPLNGIKAKAGTTARNPPAEIFVKWASAAWA